MRTARLTEPAGRGGALCLPASASWSGPRGSAAAGMAGRPAAMHVPRLVHAAAGGRRAPSDPLSRTPRRAAQLHHSSQQPVHLEGANNIVPAPQHAPLPTELGGQKVQPATSSHVASSGDAPAAHAAATQPADQAPPSTAGPGPAGTASTGSWTDGRTASQLAGLHRPAGLVVGSAWLLAFSLELAGVSGVTPAWLPVLAGGALGGLAATAHHAAVRHVWRMPARPLRVVITGGSCGIGKALAREFLKCGDVVVVTSRSEAGAERAAQHLREEVGPGVRVTGVACDVSDPASVERLVGEAAAVLGGGIDVWVNNAGYSGSFQSLVNQPAESIAQVVRTNLLGSLLATQAAMKHMAAQPGGGHIFNFEGAGSDGAPTPQYAAYGATKAAIAQLLRTLQTEASALPGAAQAPVRVHNLSPGMVLTDLLLEGATPRNKQAPLLYSHTLMHQYAKTAHAAYPRHELRKLESPDFMVFNILCEHPETVAAFLVPRARSVVARGDRGAAIRYLTPARVLAKLLAAPLRAGRYFDSNGDPVYPPERQRILGERAKRTQRLQRAAARRGAPLRLAYSFAMAACFLMIAASGAVAGGP
ncbi:putative chlorophyll(ide) b reductase chloroplastic isoform B [Chlorella sorokiniana]|uniref:Chlorophyll(Ide) b reductase chloroplastic isoform B n=1 Tax=Chlorella sorokiniana TaxID=3076 RepID=A0A2P6TSA9_CHLSO|nr:putative chlorophyll(ide) b reductase chloroplastic isoform B [Chlorella sorokiniana]|eukprot:PRW56949.1 putative chlorophyll(ide) b reductase chloroplastic isoform B [Chlorella sorokiniana]